jgi:hypothetical protein
VFGNDKSIVRVRNRALHNLHRKLTKGITFVDYKTKWEWYDLRISVHAPQYIQDLADAIEDHYFRKGLKKDLTEQIKKIEPDFNKWMSNEDLAKYLDQINGSTENS